jgi:nucleoside 2-deoxyribosyltransferase
VTQSTVYLAGPITGLTYAGAVDWREHAKAELAKSCIRGLSPMRGKQYLEQLIEGGTFTMDGDAYKAASVLSSNRGIMTRDRWDATRCDVLLVNFLGATKVSIGTCMEIAWADAHRIPIVCAMEATGNIHDHGMILEALGYRVQTLAEALDIIRAVLS